VCERYLAQLSFGHPAQDLAYAEYRAAVSERHERVERLTEALWEQAGSWRMAGVVKALMTLRGIDRIAAVMLAAELVGVCSRTFRRYIHRRDAEELDVL